MSIDNIRHYLSDAHPTRTTQHEATFVHKTTACEYGCYITDMRWYTGVQIAYLDVRVRFSAFRRCKWRDVGLKKKHIPLDVYDTIAIHRRAEKR